MSDWTSLHEFERERLEEELTAERKRREEAEKTLEKEREQSTAYEAELRQRAEQAERERDWARGEADGVRKVFEAERDEWRRKALERDLEVTRISQERDDALEKWAAAAKENAQGLEQYIALKQRCERAEADVYRLQQEVDEWKENCGLVGPSGDPANVMPAHLANDLRQREAEAAAFLARAERAEADNAALFDVLRASHDPHVFGCSGAPCVCGAIPVMKAEHPGAALLEYVRALEGVRIAADDALECMEEEWPTRPATMSLRRACTTADALKVKP